MENLNRIKEVLDEKGITQTWLADKMKMSRTGINNLCSNFSQPSLKRLYEIANHLAVDPSELLATHKKKVPTVTVTNGTKNHDPQRTHERLVDLLNKFYGVEKFATIDQPVTVEKFVDINQNQLHAGTGLLVTANNLVGGDIADVQLYSLIETYLKDSDKRAAINELL